MVLELGSKDPMIVLEDADLDVASSGAVWGAMMNCGQTCLSIERCYVQRSVYEKFLNFAGRRSRGCALAKDWIRKSKWVR